MALILMILGFIWWWPLGLIVLAVLIASGRIGCWHRAMYAGNGPFTGNGNGPWSGSMGCWNHGMSRWENKMQRMQDKIDRARAKVDGVRAKMDGMRGGDWWGGAPSSGNRAFDDYRSETLKRLEDEQREFREFLDRLRFAKDKTEFDQFMAERRSRPDDSGPQPQS